MKEVLAGGVDSIGSVESGFGWGGGGGGGEWRKYNNWGDQK